MEVYRFGSADIKSCAPKINILWCSIRDRAAAVPVIARDLAIVKSQ
jgi:hypothetical protein